MMGYEDLQKNLHTPSLLLNNTIHSLHEMTHKTNTELTHLDARVVCREDHIHLENTFKSKKESMNSSFIEPIAAENEKWINLRRQDIIFEGEKCLLLSLRDVSASHKLSKSNQKIELLKKLSSTISEDLIDPLSLIVLSVKWLIRWQKRK